MAPHIQISFLVFMLTILFHSAGIAYSGDTIEIQDTSQVENRPNVNPVMHISRVPNGSIVLDGVLDEEVWRSAAVARNFTETQPGNNVKPEVETFAYALYDDDYIYFAFECYDDMKSVRASMTDRDRMYSDDWAGVVIDTYGNLHEAFEFFANPHGIQGDLIWTPNYETSSRDFIYYTETKIHSDKWVLEMKIPFKSLNFPNRSIQEWRIHFIRNRPRNLRQMLSWSAIFRDNPDFLGQAGFLMGLENVKSGNNFEILPYVAGIESAKLSEPVNSGSSLKYDTPDFRFGFDVKYGITSDLNINGTFNPDFSQVEADAPQIDVNNPFALFFEERRPFFLDGENSFRTHQNFVYTRAINNPLLASKITGKIGKKLDLGYMIAYDENTPFVIPLEDRSFVLASNLGSLANILRLKYDLGNENYVGVLLTDREYSTDSVFTTKFSGYNRTIGADFRFKFLKNFYFNGQFTHHSEREISDTNFFNSKVRFGQDNKYTAAFDGESFTGISTFFSFQRRSENYGFWADYSYNSPTARRGSGFLSRNNVHSFFTGHYYNFYLDNDFVRRITPDLDIELRYNSEGLEKRRYLNTGATIEFTNGTRLWGNYRWVSNENFRNVQLDNIIGWNFGIENNALQLISGGMWYSNGRNVVRFEQTPTVGSGQDVSVWFSLRPVDRITSHFNYNYSELSRLEGGEMLYAGWTFNNGTSYQFNKNLFVRVNTQYNSFSKSLSIDPLISYKWNPFTVFYIGTTHRFEQILDDVEFGKSILRESSRQIFLKFQYLFQM